MAKSGGRDMGERTAEVWEILTQASMENPTVLNWGKKPLVGALGN